jgi:hypothetical protein
MATIKINSLLRYVQGIKYGLYAIIVNVSITKSYIVLIEILITVFMNVVSWSGG